MEAERAADLRRRAHAEAQVGRQPRGGVLGEHVPAGPVRVGPRADEGREPPPRRRRARGQRRLSEGRRSRPSPGRSGPSMRRGAGMWAGIGASRQARWKALNTRYPDPDEPGRSSGSARRSPGIIRTCTPTASSAAVTRPSRARAKGETSRVTCTARAPASAATSGTTTSGRPRPHHEAAAARAQLLVEGLEAGAEEAQPRGGAVVPPPQQGGVEHEEADDAAGVDRLAQRGMVRDSEVAPEPDDGRETLAHARRPPGARGPTRASRTSPPAPRGRPGNGAPRGATHRPSHAAPGLPQLSRSTSSGWRAANSSALLKSSAPAASIS